MKAINNYQDLAFALLSKMYRSEHQYITYLQVFDNKASSKRLKSLLFDLKQSTNYKLHLHHQLIRRLKSPLNTSAGEGMNGIFKEAFLTMKEGGTNMITDTIILNTIMLASHYKLGSYLSLSLYLRVSGFENETKILQKIINTEESVLRRINALINEQVMQNTFQDLYEESVA